MKRNRGSTDSLKFRRRSGPCFSPKAKSKADAIISTRGNEENVSPVLRRSPRLAARLKSSPLTPDVAVSSPRTRSSTSASAAGSGVMAKSISPFMPLDMLELDDNVPKHGTKVMRSSSIALRISRMNDDPDDNDMDMDHNVFDTSLSPIKVLTPSSSSPTMPSPTKKATSPEPKPSIPSQSPKDNSNMSSFMQDSSMACPDTTFVVKSKRRKRKKTYSDDEDELSFFESFKRKKRRNTCTGEDADTLSMRSFSLRKRRNTDSDSDTVSLRSFSLRSSFRIKRDSKPDLDTLSLQSFSMGNKRNRSLVRVGSLANILSPVSSVKKVGQAIQRSMSLKGSHGGAVSIKPYCKPPATPTKRRDSKLWSETVQGNINEALTKIEIKRQEAIFELLQGEVDLVDDLYLVMKTYRDAMRSLQILTDQDLNIIFGSLDELRMIHEEFMCDLQKQRGKNGATEEVGQVLLKWLPMVTEVYVTYCTNQLAAKNLLDEKKQDSKVNDFLERCIESPFSRKLDLWNFLDVPRSRLVKYPLLFKNILKVTPSDHKDKINITQAIKLCKEIITEVDRRTGETKCKNYIDMFDYLDERQRNHLIAYQKVLLCGGVLKSSKGTKLHVFLFEDILVVTRQTTRNNRKCYQVYRQPIPVRTMALEDIPEGEVKRSGSFRGALSHGPSVKCGFKVRSTDPNLSQSFTLHSSDEHDKKQWLQLFRSAIRRARQDETCV
ncbi:rho guanine nucleotide exchange factor 3-like [Lytechinus variegatus]|uniref:rho guanine nucleotide exchange factor 3-like n=1 Tax=Lytechinus variegatus TaxID=7654 RepID=UPI001BB1A629|nr:rho guanine nucleotide exchange factor 3-like [Lytechinus variegatus]